MRIKLFHVGAMGDDEGESALNAFLANHRVVDVERRLHEGGLGVFWVFCVSYLDGEVPTKRRDKPNYRDTLSEEAFARFEALREWRRGVADAAGLPTWRVFNNAELAAIAERAPRSVEDLDELKDVQKDRRKTYGVRLIEQLKGLLDEASGKPDTPDSDPG